MNTTDFKGYALQAANALDYMGAVSDNAAAAEYLRELATDSPAAVLVPVGILERAAAILDDLADDLGAADLALQEDRREPGDDPHAFARALYAAGRGEVDWSAV